MVGTTTGWAIGRNQLYRTTDGGQQWRDVTPTGSSLASAATLGSGLTAPPDRAFVLNATTAWVLVGSKGSEFVEHTTDGGAKWTEQRLPAQPIGNGTYLEFSDGNDGWMMINGGVAMGHMAAGVYTTVDGGTSWTEVGFASGNESGGTLPFFGDKRGVSTSGPKSVWIGGISTASIGAYLVHSSDGGHTWALQPVQTPLAYSQQQFQDAAPKFFGNRTGILALVSNGTMLLFTTGDSGGTWQMQSALASKLRCATFLTSFASATDGWVLPRGGCGDASAFSAIEKTTNGGVTWALVAPAANLASRLPAGSVVDALDFADAAHGWMLAATTDQKGLLLRTSDGGAHWTVSPVRVG